MAAEEVFTSAQVEEKARLCLSNRRNVNNIVDILSLIESTDDNVVIACIGATQRIFKKFLSTHEMADRPTDNEKESAYRKWIQRQYGVALSCLCDQLYHGDEDIQKLCIVALMNLIASEGHHPLTSTPGSNITTFPTSNFMTIANHLLSKDQDNQILVGYFKEFLSFDDIRYHTLNAVTRCMKNTQSKDFTELLLSNIFILLENISNYECCSKFHAVENVGKMVAIASPKEHAKLFTSAWTTFLELPLTPNLHKRSLIILQAKVMPKLTNPLVLSNYLTNCYSSGGVISLLSLDGLFLLVNNHNLEYPLFYEQLYSLLEPAVLHVVYRDRFLHLLELFLSSTYLSSCLIASFIKKLARISLTAPCVILPGVITLITNLLKAHPACHVLAHRPNDITDFSDDPYLYDEADPAKSDAIKSSLWEIKTLQTHFCPQVAKLAARINHPLQQSEDILGNILNKTDTEMMEKEIKKKKTVHMTFESPKGIFGTSGDRLHQHWLLL